MGWVNDQHIVMAGGAVNNVRLLRGLAQAGGISPTARSHIGRWLFEHPHFYKAATVLLRLALDRALTPERRNRADFVSITPRQTSLAPGDADFNWQVAPTNPNLKGPAVAALLTSYASIHGFRSTLYAATLGMEQRPFYKMKSGKVTPDRATASLQSPSVTRSARLFCALSNGYVGKLPLPSSCIKPSGSKPSDICTAAHACPARRKRVW